MQRILVGYDGSERGDDALALGRTLAAVVDDPHVVVATIHPALIPRDSHGTPSLHEERLHYEAQQLLEHARTGWQELARTSCVAMRASSPSAGLHLLAVEGDFDVIVVGASHRQGLGRIWSGSATEQTLQGAPRPVAVAPPGYAAAHPEPARLRRIGIGYDGTNEARHALELAAELARAAAATTVAIDVAATHAPPLTDAYGYGSFAEGMAELARVHAEGGREALQQLGVASAESASPQGSPADELIAASEELDLLVLGSRAHGPARRLLLGSTSARVIRAAACPVLLFPRSAAVEPVEGDAGEATAVGRS